MNALTLQQLFKLVEQYQSKWIVAEPKAKPQVNVGNVNELPGNVLSIVQELKAQGQ